MADPDSNPRLRPVIRVFVSSTFTDMKHERNALQEHVFPKLEQMCLKSGFQFQAIDLRWGVSNEASLDHRTMRICFDELRRAQEISPRPNFLILLGDRYGWRPLPEEISVGEFQELERVAGQVASFDGRSAVTILRDWYRKDENAAPPVHVLQSRRQDMHDGQDYTKEDGAWNEVQAVLWAIINRAIPPEELKGRFDAMVASDELLPPSVRFQASATEQEIWHGALRVSDAKEHVLAYFREIENAGEFADPKQIKDFVDVGPSGAIDAGLRAEQERLKNELSRRLGESNLFGPGLARLVPISDHEGRLRVDVTRDHLIQLCADLEKRLTEIIKAQIGQYWRETTHFSAERALRELRIEQDEHERFGRERGSEKSFVGRQVELQAILNYVRSDSHRPLVVHGASGCGKTALLARAAQEVTKTLPAIVRFIGVMPRSSDIRSLLSSLCQELRVRHPRESELPVDVTLLRQELHDHFRAATADDPLVLFLDALDQLSDADNGRQLHWLPTGLLPAHVKLVVSCLSDRAEGDPAGEPFMQLKQHRLTAESFINLDVLSEKEAGALIFDRWLPRAGRTVSAVQRKCIEQRLISTDCRQPIYLKLVFEEARLWRSYDEIPNLGDGVPALLDQFFARLSGPTNHGPLLVNRVLGYLAASRYGLAEAEILEILFADPEYRAALDQAAEQTRHEMPPDATRIPVVIWSRLRFDLAPYITERAATGANVLTFYHRQVAEWVREHVGRAADQSWQPHHRLAAHFRRLADPREDRRGKSDRAGFNSRCVFELPWQLAEIGQWHELSRLLASHEFLAAMKSASPHELLEYWARIERATDFRAKTIYSEVLQRPELYLEHDLALYIRDLLNLLGYRTETFIMDCYLEEYFRAQGRLDGLASCLNGQAIYFLQSGPLSEASRVLRLADHVLEELGDVRGRAAVTGNRALVLLLEKDLPAALTLALEQERLARRAGDRTGVIRAMCTQAHIYSIEQNSLDANRIMTEAEAMASETEDFEALGHCLLERVRSSSNEGEQPLKSLALLEEAERHFKWMGNRAGLAKSLAWRGILYLELGRRSEAWTALAEASHLAESLGDARLTAQILLSQSIILAMSGETDQAARARSRAAEVMNRFGAPIAQDLDGSP